MSLITLIQQILIGIPTTLMFVVIAWILGLLLGILVTIGRLSHSKVLRGLLATYVSFTRSIPIILQLFLVYYGLPTLLNEWGIDLSGLNKMYFCVTAYVFYYGAYLSEVFRPAYLAVDRQQYETAIAMGYTRWYAQIKIVIPQVIPIALPALGNETINLIHQSSLLFIIGVVDLMGQAEEIIAENYTVSPILVYFLAGIIYWLLTVVIARILKKIEIRSSLFLIGG